MCGCAIVDAHVKSYFSEMCQRAGLLSDSLSQMTRLGCILGCTNVFFIPVSAMSVKVGATMFAILVIRVGSFVL